MKSLASLHKSILQTTRNIYDHVRKTPLDSSAALSEMTNANVYMKLESEQMTGSFKTRGAFNKLSKLMSNNADRDRLKENGVIVASSGNHSIACALACQTYGVKLTANVPESITEAKSSRILKYNAKVIKHDLPNVDIEKAARKQANEFGTEYISPYNDMDVIIGSETIGFEILENLPHVDAVFVPVGGGGLISGIAAYIKAIKPSVQIIGCQSEVNNAMQMCVDAGKIEDFELQDTICDGVAGGVETNSVTFDICKSYVDKWITCSEEATAKGVMFMMEHHHRVIETSGALPIAAFLSVADEYKDKNVVLVISGCNISIDKIKYILNEYHNS